VAEIEFNSVSPIVPVRDLDIALDRYRALEFAYVEPDGTLHRIGSRVG
jgi:hypothetical protein